MHPLALAGLAGLFLAVPAPAQDLTLGTPLQDHMVVQHDQPVPLWGTGEPGLAVDATMGEATAGTTVLADGTWTLSLPAPGLGEDPYAAHTITLVHGDTRHSLDDVLAGEVWLASGQSNMEWPVSRSLSAENLPERGRVEGLRMFTAARRSVAEPQAEVAGSWAVMDADTVSGFSAVGTHFGLELLEALDRPVGILHSSWGGSRIEAWTSPRALAATGAGAAVLEAWGEGREGAELERAAYPRPRLTGHDADGWTACELPASFEELTGKMQGVVWLRREVALPEGAAAPRLLSLGAIDEADEVWLGGVPVGSGTDWQAERRYELSEAAAATLATGATILTVRAENVYGWGGFSSAPELLHLELADGTRLPLTDGWSWKAGAKSQNMAANHRPTHLSNGMLVGLEPVPVRGFIWYQGESNAFDPVAYTELFPAMIQDWRDRFLPRGDGPLPFHFVQLANFLPRGAVDWPGLREAQRRTLELPATGMAVIVDVGNPTDIHPRDKHTVGERLARWALWQNYGQDVVPSGPLPGAANMTDAGLVLELETFGTALVTRDGAELVGGLEIVCADGTSHPVAGRIDGGRIPIDLRTLPEDAARPIQLRYAWADDPVSANLTNDLGLPASPFQVWIRWNR